MKTAEPIRSKEKIREMGEYYLQRGQLRNYALLMTGIHSALRISDLLRLCWGDVYDYARNRMRKGFEVRERKTRKTKWVALHRSAAEALLQLFCSLGSPSGNRPLFESHRAAGRAIGRVQAYRILREAAVAAELEGTISCHSLRKTFGYHSWKNEVSLAVIMEIFNHSSFAVSKRYLGITQDDKNCAYLGLRLTVQATERNALPC